MGGRLDGRVAVVTGGGNGIGQACVLRFAEEGAHVVVADVQGDAAEAVAAEVRAMGRDAAACRLEASSRGDNDAMAALAVERFGRIDVLVTAAGISHGGYRSGDVERDATWTRVRAEQAATPGRALVELDPADWQRVLDVNLTGTLFAVQACAARMLDAGRGGSIVTIASIAAKHPDAGPLPYTVSKAGVWMLTKKAARDLAPAGIRVNSIGPGYIETNMTRAVFATWPERKDQMQALIPLGRLGRPRDIADAALFLAGDESAYMTGEILHPDGGFFTE